MTPLVVLISCYAAICSQREYQVPKTEQNRVLLLLETMPSPLCRPPHLIESTKIEKQCRLISAFRTRAIDDALVVYLRGVSPLFDPSNNKGVCRAAVSYALARYLFKIAPYKPEYFSRIGTFFGYPTYEGSPSNWPSGRQLWPWEIGKDRKFHFRGLMRGSMIISDDPIDALQDFKEAEKFPRRSFESHQEIRSDQ